MSAATRDFKQQQQQQQQQHPYSKVHINGTMMKRLSTYDVIDQYPIVMYHLITYMGSLVTHNEPSDHTYGPPDHIYGTT